jgi:hypothetical protein
MSCNYKFYNPDELKKDWYSGQKIIYTAAQPIMQESREFWKMLLLLSSAARCNRAGAKFRYQAKIVSPLCSI